MKCGPIIGIVGYHTRKIKNANNVDAQMSGR